MATDTADSHSSGAVAEAKDKGGELVSTAQEQITAKAHELGGEANFQIREQLDQRSTQAGEQLQSIGRPFNPEPISCGAKARTCRRKVVEEIARRADDLGDYLQSAQADRMLGDVEQFARRRPWLTAGVGVLAGFLASRFVKASGDRRYEGVQTNGRGYPSTPRSLPTGSR